MPSLTKMIVPVLLGVALISGCVPYKSKKEISIPKPVGKYGHIDNEQVKDLINLYLDEFYEEEKSTDKF